MEKQRNKFKNVLTQMLGQEEEDVVDVIWQQGPHGLFEKFESQDQSGIVTLYTKDPNGLWVKFEGQDESGLIPLWKKGSDGRWEMLEHQGKELSEHMNKGGKYKSKSKGARKSLIKLSRRKNRNIKSRYN
jgi:hypothetical protein